MEFFIQRDMVTGEQLAVLVAFIFLVIEEQDRYKRYFIILKEKAEGSIVITILKVL
ncbi:hypothetical protein VII00023_15503 [Vibrio ichthyoenteri ATCC 700023]|uniref:Uncharacterized protein n=1 Tax=Vibrio ichthyoenteri ATCC 700023 TaxID=870968 RepID=F9S626_9VIBR|nr:hypothetical protein VII00023_15503 [Vibrio ichthyoenteri ATCC 700023]